MGRAGRRRGRDSVAGAAPPRPGAGTQLESELGRTWRGVSHPHGPRGHVTDSSHSQERGLQNSETVSQKPPVYTRATHLLPPSVRQRLRVPALGRRGLLPISSQCPAPSTPSQPPARPRLPRGACSRPPFPLNPAPCELASASLLLRERERSGSPLCGPWSRAMEPGARRGLGRGTCVGDGGQ